MKIGVMPNIFPKLSKTFILYQITGMIDRGHDVEVYPSHPAGESVSQPAIEEYDIGDRTTFIGPPNSLLTAIRGSATNLLHLSFRYPEVVRAVLRTIRKDGIREAGELTYRTRPILDADVDILHAHFGPVGRQAAKLHRIGAGDAFVTSFHGWGIRTETERARRTYRELFELCDCLLANSEHTLGKLRELGADPEKTRVHHVGIDPDRFEPTDESSDPETVTVLTVARLHEIKGLEYGIRGFAGTVERLPEFDLEYRIVGGGPRRTALEELIRSTDVGNRVTLCGPKATEEVVDELREADLFLLPSLHEGFGTVLLEAQASGLPVIASDVGGIREAVAPGDSAILVPAENPGAITDELEHLIRNPSQRAEIGTAGRSYVRGNFDIRDLNDRLEELYRRLLQEA